MNDNTCPWCEAELPFETLRAQSGECAECHTTWQFEDVREELLLAA